MGLARQRPQTRSRAARQQHRIDRRPPRRATPVQSDDASPVQSGTGLAASAEPEDVCQPRAASFGRMTVNGVRIELKDGSWGLVRPSSNKPELVIVAESPEECELARYPDVGGSA
jgi:phosphomannomutase